jgi:hypothetical protein
MGWDWDETMVWDSNQTMGWDSDQTMGWHDQVGMALDKLWLGCEQQQQTGMGPWQAQPVRSRQTTMGCDCNTSDTAVSAGAAGADAGAAGAAVAGDTGAGA